MEVILLKNVTNLGALGDRVKVRGGYGRNYLIPQGFAVPATPENIKAFEERRAELERAAAEALARAQARKAQFEGIRLTIARKAGDEGRLFGSVGAADIAEAARELGLELARSEVRLPKGPFRSLGEYDVRLHLHPEVDVEIKVAIVPSS